MHACDIAVHASNNACDDVQYNEQVYCMLLSMYLCAYVCTYLHTVGHAAAS